MNITLKVFVLCFLCLINSLRGTGSIVYNLRVTETTKRSIFEQLKIKPNIAIGTAFDQFRKRDFLSFRENLSGAMFTYVYMPCSFYFKVDWALGNDVQWTKHSSQSKTQLDDILFSSGYGFQATKKTNMTVSALLGVPTHKDRSLMEAQFGTGHLGLGGQLDGAYKYAEKLSLRFAARGIHFFKRTTKIPLADLEEQFIFALGNLTDLLISNHLKYNKHNAEIGYNASFLTNAHLTPNEPAISNQIDYIRSDFYISYAYGFLIRNHLSGFILGFSYGFDHLPKMVGLKQIFTGWLSWGINF
ncbi:MAG: hypothetical protein ACLPWD_07145 [Methanobacterium sp.]